MLKYFPPILLGVIILFPAFGSAKTVNLASQVSRTTASASLRDFPAEQATDGVLNSFWWVSKQPQSSSWIELDWTSPVKIREVVIKQYTHRRSPADVTEMRVEVWKQDGWKEVRRIGDGKVKLPVLILSRFPLQATTKLRLSGIHGTARIREIEVYEGPTPPWLDIRSDALGNAQGVLSDGWGTKGIAGASIVAVGEAAGKPWRGETRTGSLGAFALTLPPGLEGPVNVTASWSGGPTIHKMFDAGSLRQQLVPRSSDPGTMLFLTGIWRFHMDPPEGFESRDFDDSAWPKISVPSHWTMKGFQSPDQIGGYRRHIRIPGSWRGMRVRLAFDGVYSSAEVWLNGKRIGSHAGGANSFQLDITNAVLPGQDNVVALKVAESSMASKLDHMSLYACFPLAGIYRKAYVFAVPAVHVARIHTSTSLNRVQNKALLSAKVLVANESDRPMDNVEVQLELAGPTGSETGHGRLSLDLRPWSEVAGEVEISVANPSYWEAEHPNLYSLRMAISQAGRTVQRLESKVGVRDVKISGTKFLINGVPVKLKGTCHHDSHPLMGRAVTPELERLDVKLIKGANLNALRTSHYPPLPELIEAADEQGLYVEDEASFCWANNSYDLRYLALAKEFAAELVERDRNHPSVVLWSSGNESLWGTILSEAEHVIRRRDTTRPVIGSWSDRFDMTIRHNPMTVKLIEAAADQKKPINWDESLCIYQGLWGDGEEIWRDPGYRDYYVSPLIAVYEAFWKSPVVQGSFIWAWSDDLFDVPHRSSEVGRMREPLHVLDSTYHVPDRGLVGGAPWGVVDGWRRKKPEYWHIKELHSPVKVRTREVPFPGRDQPLRIPVENRYNFTSLSELQIEWRMDGGHGRVRSVIPPGKSGTLEVPITVVPKSGDWLTLRFTDRNGEAVQTAEVRVGKPALAANRPNASGKLSLEEDNTLGGRTLRVVADEFEIGFSRRNGYIRRALAEGRPVLYQPLKLHLLPAQSYRPEFPAPETWRLDGPLEVKREGADVIVTANGKYANLAGSYRTRISPSGKLTIIYDFKYSGPDIMLREIGLGTGVPPWLDELRWRRNGEWSYYPDSHIGRNGGTAMAHSGKPDNTPPKWSFAEDDSPMGTNDFRSQKRNFTFVQLSGQNNAGLRFFSDGSQDFRAMVEDDHIAVFVNNWFGGTDSVGEWIANYGEGKLLKTGGRVSGTVRMQLIPRPSGDQASDTTMSPHLYTTASPAARSAAQ